MKLQAGSYGEQAGIWWYVDDGAWVKLVIEGKKDGTVEVTTNIGTADIGTHLFIPTHPHLNVATGTNSNCDGSWYWRTKKPVQPRCAVGSHCHLLRSSRHFASRSGLVACSVACSITVTACEWWARRRHHLVRLRLGLGHMVVPRRGMRALSGSVP